MYCIQGVLSIDCTRDLYGNVEMVPVKNEKFSDMGDVTQYARETGNYKNIIKGDFVIGNFPSHILIRRKYLK